MDGLSTKVVVGLAAFLAGIVFGAIVHRTHFCTMGAIADAVLFGDGRRLRAWLLAMAVALIGTQAFEIANLLDLNASFYRTSDFLWLGAVLGGLLFGFGMTLTGGCVSRNLVRLGAGNLKSLIVLLVLGVSAYMTMNGLLALPRLQVESIGKIVTEDQGVTTLLGIDGPLAFVVAAAIAAAIIVFCLRDPKFRASRKDVAAGLLIGGLIPLGWLITGLMGADDFEPEPLASFSFVAPVARSLVYLMTYPAAPISFGIAAVGGVLSGAFLAARLDGTSRIEGFSGIDDLVRHLIGAILMGVGGVLGLGCTIGQGITGVSTMAIGSILTTLCIMAGAVLGVRYLECGSLKGAVLLALPAVKLRKSTGE
jgi:uncharacterized membrane protein YedE/YeeE